MSTPDDQTIGPERMRIIPPGGGDDDEQPLWLKIYFESKSNREWFKAGVAVYSVLDFVMMLFAFHHGYRILAGLGELLASPVLVLGFGLFWERGKLSVLADPHKASWAFWADWFALAPYAIVACAAWVVLPPDRWYNSGLGGWIWAAVALSLGAAASLSFRRSEGAVYDVLRYLSYSKMCHNGVAFTVLTGMIIYTLIPTMLAGVWSGGHHLPLVMLFLLVLWVLAAAGDAVRASLPDDSKWIAWKLHAENLHPRANRHGLRITRDLGEIPTYAQFKSHHPTEVPWWSKIFQGRLLLQALKSRRSRKN